MLVTKQLLVLIDFHSIYIFFHSMEANVSCVKDLCEYVILVFCYIMTGLVNGGEKSFTFTN